MRMLRDLYHSIPLADWNPTYSVLSSDCWLKSYPYFCTLFPWASTFTLLATECYSYADTSRPIPCNSPHQADFNTSCPGLARGLVLKLFPLLYFYSPVFVPLVRLPLRTNSKLMFSRLTLTNIFPILVSK